jgi:hypothetical protein
LRQDGLSVTDDGARSAMAREVEEVFKLASSARDVESDLVTLAEYSGQYLPQPG